MRIVSGTAQLVETPLHRPFVTAQGSADVARAVQVAIELENASVVVGESVPVSYVTGETIESVLATCNRILPHIFDKDLRSWGALLLLIHKLAPNEPSARCALEMAVLYGFEKTTYLSPYMLLGGCLNEQVSDITLPMLPEVEAIAQEAWDKGFRIFKIKVGNPTDDLIRVQRVISTCPRATLRIDANQAFSPEEAVIFAESLQQMSAPVQMLEQPVTAKDIDGMNWVAERSPIPIFADESLLTPQDALRLANTAVHGFNLKINKNGIRGVLDIIPIAKAAGKLLMLGCMLETRHSICFSLELALGTGAFDFLDLDSHHLLNEPGENRYFYQVDGMMRL